MCSRQPWHTFPNFHPGEYEVESILSPEPSSKNQVHQHMLIIYLNPNYRVAGLRSTSSTVNYSPCSERKIPAVINYTVSLLNQSNCGKKKKRDADSAPAPWFIMSWQELLNNQLSLPNVSAVCQVRSSRQIWAISVSDAKTEHRSSASDPTRMPLITLNMAIQITLFHTQRWVFASSWWLQRHQEPWSRVRWRTLLIVSKFFLAVDISQTKSAKRTTLRVCSSDSTPRGNFWWKNLAPKMSENVARYNKKLIWMCTSDATKWIISPHFPL